MLLHKGELALNIMKLNLRYLLTLTLCLLMITGAKQVCAEEAKPVSDKIQTATPETDKKVLETEKSAEEEKPTGDLSVSVLSAFYSNGVETSRNSAIIQPALTLGYKGFTANVWGNIDTGPYQTPADKTKKTTLAETHFNLSYIKTLGYVNLGAGYSYVGFSPPYDGAARPDDQQEAFAILGLNVPLNPTLTVFKLFDKGHRWYFQMGVSHIFELNKVVSLKLSGTAAYMIGEDPDYATEAKYDDDANKTSDKYNAFLDGVVSVCLPLKVTEHITIIPTISYAFPLTTEAKNYMKGNGMETVTNNVDRASSFLFGGLVLSFSF